MAIAASSAWAAPALNTAVIDPADFVEFTTRWEDRDGAPFVAQYATASSGHFRNLAGLLARAPDLSTESLRNTVEGFLEREDGTFAFTSSDSPTLANDEHWTNAVGAFLSLDQEWEGVPLRYGNLVASFSPDGWLVGLHGIYWSHAGAEIGDEVRAGTPGNIEVVIATDAELAAASVAATRRRIIDPFSQTVLVELTSGDDRFLVDEITGHVEHLHLPNGATANIWHEDNTIPAESYNLINDTSWDFFTTTARTVECDGFYAYLKRTQLTRGFVVHNHLGADWIVPCSAPGFDRPGTWDAKAQAHAYAWIYETRSKVAAYMWNQVSPNRTSDLSVYVEAAESECPTNACFKWWPSPNVFLEATDSARKFDTMAHEYGHYVVWTYGGLGNSCNAGVDESNVVDEAIADFVAHLVIREHAWAWPGGYTQDRTYRSLGAYDEKLWRINSRGMYTESDGCIPSAYTGPDQCSYYDVVNWCVIDPVPGDDEFGRRFMANPLRAAMWQIMHNVRCSLTATVCEDDGTNNVHNRSDLGWSSKVQATRSLAAAMAYALAVTGENVTMNDITFWVYFWWLTQSEHAQASAAYAVFADHGLTW